MHVTLLKSKQNSVVSTLYNYVGITPILIFFSLYISLWWVDDWWTFLLHLHFLICFTKMNVWCCLTRLINDVVIINFYDYIFRTCWAFVKRYKNTRWQYFEHSFFFIGKMSINLLNFIIIYKDSSDFWTHDFSQRGFTFITRSKNYSYFEHSSTKGQNHELMLKKLLFGCFFTLEFKKMHSHDKKMLNNFFFTRWTD
jgi:hypothetical protein